MSEDSDFFDKYHQINSVQKPDIDCDENCKAYHLCTISQQDYQYFDQCVEKSHSSKTQWKILMVFFLQSDDCLFNIFFIPAKFL